MTDPELLAELERLDKAATAGPCKIKYEYNVFGGSTGERLIAGCGGYSSNIGSGEIVAENIANASIIAMLLTHLKESQK